MKYLIQWACTALFWAFWVAQAQAAPFKVLSEHNVKAIDEFHYTVGSDDPYWVLQPNTDPKKLMITLKKLPIESERTILLELFFKEIDNKASESTQALFDPRYRLRYLITKSQINELLSSYDTDSALLDLSLSVVLLLPEGLDKIPNANIRLDIDNCTNCELSFTKTGVADNITHDDGAKINSIGRVEMTPSMLLNGTKPIPNQGISLNLDKWIANDLERESAFIAGNRARNLANKTDISSATKVTTIAEDPFLASPQLSIKAASLGGVLLDLTLDTETQDNSPLKTANVQLFYSTERHLFTERASTTVKLSIARDGAKQTVFIPLNFLSSQSPVREFLTGLRIDTDELESINEVVLVNKESAIEYQRFIPRNIYQRKYQRASGRQVVASGFNNLMNDLSFIIVYFLLVIVIATFFIRAYRR